MISLPNNEQEKDPLLRALGELGEGSSFLWKIFLISIVPTLISGVQAISYVFTADIPTHWCEVKELNASNWTKNQIKTISSASSCTSYNYNYTYFVKMGYDGALNYTKGHKLPETSECTNYLFENDLGRKSMVEEWGLLCRYAHQRPAVQMVLILGKTIGAFVFGTLSDKLGRKTVFVIGVILLSISGPLSAVVPWYWVFVILILLIGCSHPAILNSSYTILIEVAAKKNRQWMGIAYNCGYPIGTIIVTGVAYCSSHWRHVQLACTVPALILIFFIWFLPESPRWLVSKEHRDEARDIIEKPYGKIIQDNTRISIITLESLIMESNNSESEGKKKLNLFYKYFKSLWLLYSHCELRKRAAIIYVLLFVASVSNYSLALNGRNFSLDSYLYIFLLGLTKIPSCVLPIPLLMVMGRRNSTVLLYCFCSFAFLSTLVIPESEDNIIMVARLIGRCVVSAVFSIIILYTCELFPTVVRNTAFGSSVAILNVGSLLAPLIVNMLQDKVWWAPNTLCAVLVLFAGFLSFKLPETRDRKLTNTIDEELEESKNVEKSLCC
ncbi:organic cation transporter protein-like [Belonocnema kinseyi]|uniref:organic cation transporter protein-like n=1 Tax=Belonocnema kinseyi TaxID=2817044 RepID=UPI00143D8BE8|nr:organic cation transporter protein-like [Belonocnema kinseyi]